VRFQFLTAAAMKFRVFWDILPRSQADVDRRFRGAYCLHHHCYDRPYEGGSTHLLNVGQHLVDYTEVYLRRLYKVYTDNKPLRIEST
jgi:hypothetical protein